jgi:alkylresorcinol/alkylpyrone synthase
MRIAAVGAAFPPHFYDQERLLEAFREHWTPHYFNVARLEQLHRHVLVGGRHLALPMEEYPRLTGFGAANDAWIRVATEIGGAAVTDALARAGLGVADVAALFFVSVTGLATPSIDARLVNRLGLRSDLKRVPIFGLGCVAGAAGLARAADYVRAFPEEVAVLLSVELCSLTLQRDDASVANIIATGLFGDGAAAAVVTSGEHSLARIVASGERLWPDTLRIMGWDVEDPGLSVVFDRAIPPFIEAELAAAVDGMCAGMGIERADISRLCCHPGGVKVIDAIESALELNQGELNLEREVLRDYGNMSAPTVLFVLEALIARGLPRRTMMTAFGPGFTCAGMVLEA